jgi:response regulator RpfG family c-di-GMP phosphodiesterase
MITVLLIEREPAHLIGLALILRCFGYGVLEADSADEAVRNCREHLGPIHVVVTNAILDDEHASEVVARLESVCPRYALFFSPMNLRMKWRSLALVARFLEHPFERMIWMTP